MGAPPGLARMTRNLQLNTNFLEIFKNDPSQCAVKNALILPSAPCGGKSCSYTVQGKCTMVVFADKRIHI